MNRAINPDGSLGVEDLHRLAGRTVLVKSTRDRRNPPTAMRGSLEVHENPGASPDIRLAIDFPQMFTASAHRRTIQLEPMQLTRLLETEYNGAFEFTIDDELE